jgi:hypothetical protein
MSGRNARGGPSISCMMTARAQSSRAHCIGDLFFVCFCLTRGCTAREADTAITCALPLFGFFFVETEPSFV